MSWGMAPLLTRSRARPESFLSSTTKNLAIFESAMFFFSFFLSRPTFLFPKRVYSSDIECRTSWITTKRFFRTRIQWYPWNLASWKFERRPLISSGNESELILFSRGRNLKCWEEDIHAPNAQDSRVCYRRRTCQNRSSKPHPSIAFCVNLRLHHRTCGNLGRFPLQTPVRINCQIEFTKDTCITHTTMSSFV